MIKLIKSSFYNESIVKQKLANFIMSSPVLSMNSKCWEFEAAFAKKQDRKYAVFVSSGSTANLALIQALLNIGTFKQGDKVGVSALTWATNVMPLIQLGLEPVVLDCELDTLNLSTEILKKTVKKLKGLFITNSLGFSDNLEEIKNLCLDEAVVLLEDNCESLGSYTGGTLLGNFGLASTFSFFVGHHLSTIEGGMICTDDKQLYEMLVRVRAHGWNRNLPPMSQRKLREKHNVDPFYDKYTFYDLAFNIRPMEISGFLGLEALNYWDEIVNKREKNWKRFESVINTNEDFYHYDLSHMDIISSFATPVIAKSEELANKYKSKLMQRDVEVRPMIAGDISLQPFFTKHVQAKYVCANARTVHKNGFYFANNPELDEEELQLLSNLLK